MPRLVAATLRASAYFDLSPFASCAWREPMEASKKPHLTLLPVGEDREAEVRAVATMFERLTGKPSTPADLEEIRAELAKED
jgi:hypothetical protein